MAIANTTQILIDTNKRTVVRRIGVLDSDEQFPVLLLLPYIWRFSHVREHCHGTKAP